MFGGVGKGRVEVGRLYASDRVGGPRRQTDHHTMSYGTRRRVRAAEEEQVSVAG